MTSFNIIPVIIAYSVILAIIIAALYLVSRMGRQIKLGYWMLGGYTLVLVGAVVVYAFIPTEDLPAESELLREEQWTDIRYRITELGESVESMEEYKMEEWAFDVDLEETLNMQVQVENYYFPILIKEVEDRDHISISLYYDKPAFDMETVIGDTDVVRISMENSELRINLVLQQLYQFVYVTKEFPFTQFSGEQTMRHYAPHIYTGEFALYMEIPTNLNLDIAPNTDYEYVY